MQKKLIHIAQNFCENFSALSKLRVNKEEELLEKNLQNNINIVDTQKSMKENPCGGLHLQSLSGISVPFLWHWESAEK